MPWSTPTLRDTRVMVRDAVHASLPGADANVPNSLLRVMADAMGALCHLVLQYIDWLSNQLLPDTSEHEFLDRHGKIWLVNSDGSTGRKMATLAVGTIAATGQRGVVIADNAELQSGDGLGFETTATIVLGSGPTSVPVRALDPGAAGNLTIGTGMAWVTPQAGVDTTARVVQLAGGADEETDDELRARILRRIQQPPMGGDATDYEAWALEVPGVTRAWCDPLEMGIGTVSLRFMMDDLRAENAGIPLSEDVAAVEAYIDTKRPVAVKDTFVTAPVPFPINVNIRQLVTDSVSTRASIEQSLRNMLFDRAIPGGTIYASWVEAAIMDAIGVDHFELAFPTTHMPTPGHLAVLGSIVYAGG
jgi:uncharacterized phage protein gp47/JayE